METYILLKDLSIGEDNGSIKVRVSREWEGRKPGSKYVSKKNYLLLDEEGTQVHASPWQYSLISKFTKKIKVGNVYTISNYSVVHAADTYRPVPGEYVINLKSDTEVDDLDDIPTIPRYKFEITTFEEARAREGDIVTLMDVAGKLTSVSHIQTSSNGKKILEIALTDHRNDVMTMTLWVNQAYDFLEYEPEYKKPNVFIIVTSATTKLFKGKHVLWSSSSTQYFFNIDHPTITTLRENDNMKDDLIPAILPIVNINKHSMAENFKSCTIKELLAAQLPPDTKAITFLIEACVIDIDLICGWYYMACNKCNKKLKDSPECTNNKCKRSTTTPVHRYRVTLNVKDSTSTTTFVLFDRYVLKLINVSAQHILNNDKDASQEMIPAVLNNMLGKRCIFQIQLTDFNTIKGNETYTVTEVEEVKVKELVMADSEKSNTKDQLGLEEHIENKRKLPEGKSDMQLFEEPSKGILGAKVSHDKSQTERLIPATSSATKVTKEIVAKQNRNKRQK